MQASRRIDEYDVATAGFGRCASVKGDRSRIGTFGVVHKFGSGTLRPNLQLFYRRGSESVGCGNHHLVPFICKFLGELSDGRRFARSVHADN